MCRVVLWEGELRLLGAPWWSGDSPALFLVSACGFLSLVLLQGLQFHRKVQAGQRGGGCTFLLEEGLTLWGWVSRTAHLTAGGGGAGVPYGSWSMRWCLAAVVHALGDGERAQGKTPPWELLAGLLALGFWEAAFVFRACG